MDRLADFRQVFARAVVARVGGLADEALLRAFETVRRHEFVGPGPWVVREDGATTLSDDPAIVYQDMGFGLAAGIPTGLPSLHAGFLHTLQVVPGLRVMQVGAGTGYFTAILAELVTATGRVLAYEIDPALAARAQANLAAWPWVDVVARSGVAVPDEPVDLLYVNAGIQEFPREWLSALRPGGRVLFPFGSSAGHGAVFVVTRGEAERHPARFVCKARFVPCIGTQDEVADARLTAAFRGDDGDGVRSLRVAPSRPDATAWLVGRDWWLSTAP